MPDIVDRVSDFLKKYNLQDKIIVAGFSGGYDSMCLLDILAELKKSPEFAEMTIIAAHFNHNWRGEESLKEQEVCRIFANAAGVEFYTQTASGDIKKTENDAREARYKFFENTYEEYDADAILTAHNFDDNAETLLYRIVKGTGIVGLKGIAEKRGYFYRPLLSVKRSEILEYCNEKNLSPNNDSSNSDTVYKRNYLRLNVIPSLEKINPNVKESLNTLSAVARYDDEIIEEYLKPIKEKAFGAGTIDASIYKGCSKAVKMRLLHEFIQLLHLDYDYKKIQELYEFVENNITHRNGSTKSLAAAKWLYADEKIIEVIPRTANEADSTIEPVMLDGEGEFKFGGKKLVIRKYSNSGLFVFPASTSNFVYADLTNVNFPLVLRTRNDGDVISPFGMNGTMKLKKYMNSKGIPRHERDKQILLCSGEEVLWVLGSGISSKIKVGMNSKPTHVIEVI